MIKITLSRSMNAGWQAVFQGSNKMPNGIALPLPFTWNAPPQMVRDDLRTRFPDAAIITKGNSR